MNEPQDWLVPCAHCERGNVVSLHPGGTVWVNGKQLLEPDGDYFKSYGEVVYELTEANKRLAAMRESLHQSLHPQTTVGESCRYCEKDWPL